MANNNDESKMYCAFCGRPYNAVDKLIKGMGDIYICNDCVALCSSIISGEDDTEHRNAPSRNNG